MRTVRKKGAIGMGADGKVSLAMRAGIEEIRLTGDFVFALVSEEGAEIAVVLLGRFSQLGDCMGSLVEWLGKEGLLELFECEIKTYREQKG